MPSLFKIITRLLRIGGSKRPRPQRRQAAVVSRRNQPDPGCAYTVRARSEIDVRRSLESMPRARVLHVMDGDTFVASIGSDEITVRLDSIDCPEDGQPWGKTAAAGLVKMIGGRAVVLELHGQDPYRRTLATAYVDFGSDSGWTNVNERMVMLGHAWVMRRYYDHLPKDRQERLNKLERWAKSKKVGLWNTPDPIPPWRWRNTDVNWPR